MNDYLEIPLERLAPELLQAIIEEYVTREGTDYGHQEYSLEEKVGQVKKQLECGDAVIAYDALSESCTLIVK